WQNIAKIQENRRFALAYRWISLILWAFWCGMRHFNPGNGPPDRDPTTCHVIRRIFMAKSLTKSATIAKVAEMAGKALGAEVSKKQTTAVLDALVNLAYKEAKNKFTIPGMGKIELKNRKARMGRNPKTGEPIQIKAKR